MSATIYRGLFTDGEWNVIDRALGEYQDHLDDGDSEYLKRSRIIKSSRQRFTQFSNSLRKTDAPLLHNKVRRSEMFDTIQIVKKQNGIGPHFVTTRGKNYAFIFLR